MQSNYVLPFLFKTVLFLPASRKKGGEDIDDKYGSDSKIELKREGTTHQSKVVSWGYSAEML